MEEWRPLTPPFDFLALTEEDYADSQTETDKNEHGT